MNLSELLQFEKHVEGAFAGVLTAVCNNVYTSRLVDVNQTPRVSVKATIGGQFQNQKLLISEEPGWIYSSYSGKVSCTVATNRTTEKDSDAHAILTGQVRQRLHQFYFTAWLNEQRDDTPIVVFDIRPADNEDSIIDIDDVDKTMLTVDILFSINPNALPTNL